MQGWTGSSDEEQCCPSTLGAVGSGETLARLTLIRTKEPFGYTWLKRQDLFPADETPSNECGTKDGCSVDRRDTLPDEIILKRSEDFAANGKNRKGDGAYLAAVKTLRNHRLETMPDQQVLFVYDDPMPENEEHAVIRAAAEVADEERGILIEDLKDYFSKNHLKPA
jgi:hypothetical protein